jgi:hypothetical protein
MKLIDLAFYPNVPIKTVDGFGIVTGIPDFNAKSPIVRVKFKDVRSKPNALDCKKSKGFWDTVDYGFYVLNAQNKIILKDIFEISAMDAIRLGYDMKIFHLEFIRRTLYEKILINGLEGDTFKQLCQMHFDVFRLINKGEAYSYRQFSVAKA